MLLVRPPFLYKLKLGEIVTTIPTIELIHGFTQDLMWRLWNIRTLALLSGMLVARTRFVLCGDTTSRTLRVSSSWLIAMIVTV
ncbi:hypothetical protein CK203_021343 [Vitis vinifera]|uniref:Uncharacterized protein n=1 Tax=Vitis vinifera TaxID=29760 RepID=A0A438IMM9_VITVI|nr:hypothetical protein CK203_021343 [Vitis vinifera]